MKKLLLLLLFVPLAFAAWQTTAALAIFTAATLLAMVYAVGFGMDINELKMIAKEEFFQLLVLLVMIAVFYGSVNILDGISENGAFTGGSGNIQDKAEVILASWSSDAKTMLNTVTSLDSSASREASKAFQCSLFGMGYSVSSCGAYSMLNPPLGMAGGIIGFAYAEVSGMEKLVTIAGEYALKVLLPIGILLRTFKLTRGAGGFFIALAISLHIMLPLGIIFNEMLAETFDGSAAAGAYSGSPGSLTTCDADDPWGSNDNKAKSSYMDIRTGIKAYLKSILLRATLGPVIALLIVAGTIRGLSSLMGAEVDVSAIARFT
ncbi:MAG: hypothetical protein ABH842_04755 [Candidatus Micrarchaeota archaeon]